MANKRFMTIAELVESPLAQIWNALDAFGCKMRVACPGIIQAFDPNEQTVTVRPAIRESIVVNEKAQNSQLPDLIHVPVVIPRAGGYALTLPIQQGDECLVVFGDMCIDSWWQSGGLQNQLKLRRHSLSDGFAIVGIWNQTRKITNYSTSSAQLRSEDGNTVVDVATAGITIKAAKVTVNTTGDIDFTASGNVNITGTKVNIGNQTTIDQKPFLTHEHSGVAAGGGVTGPVV
jgi:phage baseplate assembly protein gpV